MPEVVKVKDKKLMEALELYENGVPVREILEKTGIHVEKLYKEIRKRGIYRKPKLSKAQVRNKGTWVREEEREAIIKDFLAGMSIYALAKKYKRSTGTIYSILRKAGLKGRQKKQ